MPKSASFFIPITKVAPTAEGHRLVTGKVSTERVDLDGQIADYGWAKKEAQAWFDIANVREQHSRNVVGKGLDLELDDAKREISMTAKVVDPVAITKLDEGLFTGFSFGAKNVPGNPIKVIKDAAAPGGRIVGGQWVEVSLADRPANPDAVLSIAKAAEGLGGAALPLEVSEALGEFAEGDLEKMAEPEPDAAKQLTGDEAIHNGALTGARASIRELIQQEVAEAEAGETYQIQILVDALSSLDCFESSEAFESQYADMVTQMAQIDDKTTRRGLYKSVGAALKKAADEHRATVAKAADLAKRAAVTQVAPDGTVTVWPETEPKPTAAAEPAAATAASDTTAIVSATDAVKAVIPDDTKFLTADAMKAVLPDHIKAILPELLKERDEALKEELAEKFAAKSVEADVEKLGKRAQPGGPVISPEAAGLRPIEKRHAVNETLEPGEVPAEVMSEMAKFAEYAKSDDLALAQSARRSLDKIKARYNLAE